MIFFTINLAQRSISQSQSVLTIILGVVAIFHLVHFAETFITFFIFNIASRVWDDKKHDVEKVIAKTNEMAEKVKTKVRKHSMHQKHQHPDGHTELVSPAHGGEASPLSPAGNIVVVHGGHEHGHAAHERERKESEPLVRSGSVRDKEKEKGSSPAHRSSHGHEAASLPGAIPVEESVPVHAHPHSSHHVHNNEQVVIPIASDEPSAAPEGHIPE